MLLKVLLDPIKNFTKLMDRKLFKKVQNLVKTSAQPCFKMLGTSKNLLKECKWRGKVFPCDKLFNTVVTMAALIVLT